MERGALGQRAGPFRTYRQDQRSQRAADPQAGLHQAPSHRLLEAQSDPAFDTKMRPIVGLYVNPPTDGPVVCADECTCIQALQRRFPDLPIRRPGELARREFEYKRHGTACLTAGLFVHTGEVLGMVTEKRPKAVFLAFLDLLDQRVPKGQVINLVVDNLNTHRGAHIETWFQAHPGRIVFYYLPFHASWLSQIELWFRTLKRRCLAGGDFISLAALKAHLEAFIQTYNRLHAHPSDGPTPVTRWQREVGSRTSADVH